MNEWTIFYGKHNLNKCNINYRNFAISVLQFERTHTLCTRNINLAEVGVVLSVLLKSLESDPLAKALIDAVVSRTLERRTFKSQVLQYLYFGCSTTNLHSALGFSFNSVMIRNFLADICEKRGN